MFFEKIKPRSHLKIFVFLLSLLGRILQLAFCLIEVAASPQLEQINRFKTSGLFEIQWMPVNSMLFGQRNFNIFVAHIRRLAYAINSHPLIEYPMYNFQISR
jgi:hypothetical protein